MMSKAYDSLHMGRGTAFQPHPRPSLHLYGEHSKALWRGGIAPVERGASPGEGGKP